MIFGKFLMKKQAAVLCLLLAGATFSPLWAPSSDDGNSRSSTLPQNHPSAALGDVDEADDQSSPSLASPGTQASDSASSGSSTLMRLVKENFLVKAGKNAVVFGNDQLYKMCAYLAEEAHKLYMEGAKAITKITTTIEVMFMSEVASTFLDERGYKVKVTKKRKSLWKRLFGDS